LDFLIVLGSKLGFSLLEAIKVLCRQGGWTILNQLKTRGIEGQVAIATAIVNANVVAFDGRAPRIQRVNTGALLLCAGRGKTIRPVARLVVHLKYKRHVQVALISDRHAE
jgi:hypothetical protein